MANLITEKKRSAIKRDYLIRLTSSFLLVLFSLCGFALAYTIPYYFVIKSENIKITQQKQGTDAENIENIKQNVSQIASQTTDELKVLELYNKNLVPSIYFSKIIEDKNPSIKITRLSMNQTTTGENVILVGGISADRAGLVAFIEDLKFEDGFSSVDSPISDFVKDKDISFTINIKVKI